MPALRRRISTSLKMCISPSSDCFHVNVDRVGCTPSLPPHEGEGLKGGRATTTSLGLQVWVIASPAVVEAQEEAAEEGEHRGGERACRDLGNVPTRVELHEVHGGDLGSPAQREHGFPEGGGRDPTRAPHTGPPP